MNHLGKCFLVGLAVFGGAALFITAMWAFRPYSGYALGGFVFCCICIALGSDLLAGSGTNSRGP
jgi:hypothetical protein